MGSRASQVHAGKTVPGAEKHAIDPKLCRIVRKVCCEKIVWHPKTGKTPPKFTKFLATRVCFRSPTYGKAF